MRASLSLSGVAYRTSALRLATLPAATGHAAVGQPLLAVTCTIVAHSSPKPPGIRAAHARTCKALGTRLSTSLRTLGATSPTQLGFRESVRPVESSTARAMPLHAPLHAVTHVKRPPDRATCTAARTPLSAKNGAREGADGARANRERDTRTAGADGPG